jgi:hypothetical protein
MRLKRHAIRLNPPGSTERVAALPQRTTHPTAEGMLNLGERVIDHHQTVWLAYAFGSTVVFRPSGDHP